MPTNPKKQAWDIVVMILLVYTATWVPIKVCFIDESTDFDFWLDSFIDLLFFIDIVVTFFTIVEDEYGQLETKRSVIAMTYIKGWFFIDLFTTIPF